MTDKNGERSGALLCLLILLAIVNVWNWRTAWPLAMSGSQGAVENLLTGFGLTAVMVSLLAVVYRQKRLLTVGGSAVAAAMYLASLYMAGLIKGDNIGIAMRVGAMSMGAFAIAAALLLRREVADCKKLLRE